MPLTPLQRAMICALPVPRSPLFTAARELLRDDGDRSAAVSQLRDTFPMANPREIDAVLREAALQMVTP